VIKRVLAAWATLFQPARQSRGSNFEKASRDVRNPRHLLNDKSAVEIEYAHVTYGVFVFFSFSISGPHQEPYEYETDSR
jgi:hypothetical protein